MGMQQRVQDTYNQRGYSADIRTLALGLCEEAGEVAAAVLDWYSPDFQPKPGRVSSDLEHELRDCLTYLCAIANVASIDLELEEEA